MVERKIKYPEYVNKNNISVENFGYDNENFRFVLKVPFFTEGENYLRVIMKNPSVASESKCDMTMRKVCNAAYEAKYDGVIIMNLFPFRAQQATDVYKNFYKDKSLFAKAIETNKKAIRQICENENVVFAWGTNTINNSKEFSLLYDNLSEEIMQIVINCANSALATYVNNSTKPLHGLRWWKTILSEKDKTLEPFVFGKTKF